MLKNANTSAKNLILKVLSFITDKMYYVQNLDHLAAAKCFLTMAIILRGNGGI